MLDGREDQATGLRRLFRRAPPSVAALFACGRDAPALAARSLLNIARGGCGRVAVLDEARGETALAPQFGLGDCGDLLHLIDGRTPVDALVQHVSPALAHLAVAGAALALPLLEDDHRERLIAGLQAVQRHCQLMLVHGASTDALRPSPFVLAAPGRLLVVEASARGVTDGYATIKRLSGAGAGDLAIAVAGAQDRGEARALFGQLEALVRRHVGLPLRFLGEVERDDLFAQLQEVAPGRRDREASAAFLRRLSAWTHSQEVGVRTGT